MHYKYAHPEFLDGVPRADFQALSGKLIIYGAGFQGLLTAYLLDKQGIKVLCFGDQSEKKQGTTYYGLPVYSPEEMKQRYPDAVPIVTPYNLRPAFEYVKNRLGYSNALTPYSLFLEFDSSGFDNLEELPDWYHPDTLELHIDLFFKSCINLLTEHELMSMDLSVTEVCNLRCKNCTSLMPCYSSPRHFDLDAICHDVEKMAKGRIVYHAYIEGGEAFLWPYLPVFISKLCNMPEFMHIYVVTNGTVIPGKDLLKALSHPKVAVRISDYGAISKKDKLIPTFKENQIKYYLQLQKWFNLASLKKEPQSGAALESVISDCCKLSGGGNAHLADGKLFRCPIQAHLHRLGIFESDKEDYVDLRQEDDRLQERLSEFMSVKRRSKIVKLCRYCSGRGFTGIEVPPAEQLAPGETIKVRFE